MHKYVIMGVQGCGKGTQAKLLAADLDLVHIASGHLPLEHPAAYGSPRVKRIVPRQAGADEIGRHRQRR
jgi:adenylate kinase